MMDKVSVADALRSFDGFWQPRTIASFNNHDIMVVKVKGEFVWHKHDETDDFFYVVAGSIDIRMPDKTVTLGPGDIYVVQRGVEHCPVAHEEAHLLLIEPTGTPNTGDKTTAQPRRVI